MSCGHSEAFQVIPSGNAAWYCRRCDDKPKASEFDSEWRYRLPRVGEVYKMDTSTGVEIRIVDVVNDTVRWISPNAPTSTLSTANEWLAFVGRLQLRRIK